jgi:hypothetical protein
MERYDIENSCFVPLRVFERPDMTPMEGLRYYWILTVQFQLTTESDDRKRTLRTTAGVDIDVAWEVANNKFFRRYISRLPFWCMTVNGGKIAICKDIFVAMKESGFTGLNEIASDSEIGRASHETVGHII